jgi:hypothetical protein
MSAADKNVRGGQKCPWLTKMSVADKNVHDGQKCPRRTKMSATDKTVCHGQKCPQRFPKQLYIPKYIIQLILTTFYTQGSS